MLINNIKKELENKGMSIYQLAEQMQMSYPACHKLVNRETLDASTLGSVVKVANILDLELEDLYTMRTYNIIEASTLVKRIEDIRTGTALEESTDNCGVATFDTLEDAKKAFEKYESELIKTAGSYYEFHEYFIDEYDEETDHTETLDITPTYFIVEDENGKEVARFDNYRYAENFANEQEEADTYSVEIAFR